MVSPAPTPRTDRPARERILLAARERFYRDGIRATGIDRVIAEAGVAKLTFYRHFPSKDALILAFLEQQNASWTDWFAHALERHRPRHGPALAALLPTIAEWLGGAHFRGCAFLNTVAELGETLPAATTACRRHKQAMVAIIAGLLPASTQRMRQARAIATAIDGAVVHAQFASEPKAALKTLADLLQPFLKDAAPTAEAHPSRRPRSARR